MPGFGGVTCHGIIVLPQYLPPNASEHIPLEPQPEAGTRFTYPGGMEGWVDLDDRLYAYQRFKRVRYIRLIPLIHAQETCSRNLHKFVAQILMQLTSKFYLYAHILGSVPYYNRNNPS